MSLKRLVANEDWAAFIEYLEEQEQTLLKNTMSSKDPTEIYRYQGEYRFIKKLVGLKERLRNG